MLIASNSVPLQSQGAMRLPPGLGYLAFTARRGLGAVATPTQPQLTVQQLLSQIGQSSAYTQFCDCTSSKYCSPSSAGCPSNQYSLCSYWGASVAARSLCWPCPSAWVSGASAGVGVQIGTGVAEASGVAAPVAALAAAGSVVPLVGTVVGAVTGLITSLFASAHAAAQKAQANAIAAGVPAANTSLQQIDAGLAAGSITPAQATSLYSQLQTTFTSLMKTGTSYKSGDALWACDLAMQLVIAARNADLKAGVMSNGQPVPSTQVSPSGASVSSGTGTGTSAALSSGGTSLSSWLPIVGLAAAAVFLVSQL